MTGRIGIVIDNGCLFKSGKEGGIRSEVVEKADLIECVILLPQKLFYNTPSQGVIIILRNSKPSGRKKRVLLINASKEYEQHPEVRKLNRLGTKNIRKIAKAYKEFSEEPGFSRIVSVQEIRENDYNLNVRRYVLPENKIEKIDIAKEWKQIREIGNELSSLGTKISRYLEEID